MGGTYLDARRRGGPVNGAKSPAHHYEKPTNEEARVRKLEMRKGKTSGAPTEARAHESRNLVRGGMWGEERCLVKASATRIGLGPAGIQTQQLRTVSLRASSFKPRNAATPLAKLIYTRCAINGWIRATIEQMCKEWRWRHHRHKKL